MDQKSWKFCGSGYDTDFGSQKNNTEFHVCYHVTIPVYFFSIITATCILGIKTAGVFFHGVVIKKLTVRTSEAEGVFEPSLQACMIAYIWIKTGWWDSVIISLMVIIRKSRAKKHAQLW